MAIENINVLTNQNPTVHKLIVQHLQEGRLANLVLCWNVTGDSLDRDIVNNIHYHANINFVNCPVCKEIWRDGIYR